MFNYRICYRKYGLARFISHLDLMKALGRAIRRAGIPIAYSQGFHPLPRLALGPPLPLGVESDAEYIDVVLLEHLDEDEILTALNTNLPQGLQISEVKEVKARAGGKVRSLTAAINRLDYAYFIKVPNQLGMDRERIIHHFFQELWSREKLPVIRTRGKQKKEVDIRPLWKGYEVSIIDQELFRLKLEVEFGPQGTIRPEDILTYIPPGFNVQKIIRVGAWIVSKDSTSTPTAILGT